MSNTIAPATYTNFDAVSSQWFGNISSLAEDFVKDGHEGALVLTNAALSILNRVGANDQRPLDISLYESCFGKFSAARHLEVTERFKCIKMWLVGTDGRNITYNADTVRNTTVDSNGNSNEDVVAFVRWSENPTDTGPNAATGGDYDRRLIHVCFPKAATTSMSMSQVVVHELAHVVYNTQGTVSTIGDRTTSALSASISIGTTISISVSRGTPIYGHVEVAAIAKADPDQAIKIADSYSVFAIAAPMVEFMLVS